MKQAACVMYSKFSCLGMWKANAVLHCVPCLKTDTTPLEQLVHATHPFLNSPKFVYYSSGSHCKATATTEMQPIVRTDHIRLASGWVPTSWTFLRRLTRGTHSSCNAWFSSRAPMTLGDTAVSCRDCWLTGVCFTAYCRGRVLYPDRMLPVPVCVSLKWKHGKVSPALCGEISQISEHWTKPMYLLYLRLLYTDETL